MRPTGLATLVLFAALSACCNRLTGSAAYYRLDAATIAHLKAMRRETSASPFPGRAPGVGVRPRSILNLGDSISYSDCFIWHERTNLRRPGMLSSEGYVYFPKPWGCGQGQTSAWGRENTPRALDRAHPEVATILFGTNDLEEGAKDPGPFIANIRAIIDDCLKRGTIPVLLAIPPARTIDPGRLAVFNEALDALARRKEIPFIATDMLFADHGGWPALTSDGVHPDSNRQGTSGYDLINHVFRQLYERIERQVIGRDPGPRKFVDHVLSTTTAPDGTQVQAIDRNGDGKTDLWRYLKGGQVVREDYDSDFDGRIDVRWNFRNGHLVSGVEDCDRDGKLETPFIMRDGWKNETP